MGLDYDKRVESGKSKKGVRACDILAFRIDSWQGKYNDLGKSYGVLAQVAPMVLGHADTGEMTGLLLDKGIRGPRLR